MSDAESVAFDRAAEYYDATRGLSPDGVARQTELLAGELGARGRVLEIGVGTGQVAIPLRRAGVDVIGADLAFAMLAKLVEKDGGSFPLVQGDATRLPFRDQVFGAAYFRWVLHLIPDWRAALAEATRVVAPAGALVVSLGSMGRDTPGGEIQRCFVELAGISIEPAGLTWAGYEDLDRAMDELGATPRELPIFTDVDREGLDAFVEGIAANRYSWTWRVEDPAVLARAADEVRRWAADRYGPLDRVPRGEYEVVWRAYDLP